MTTVERVDFFVHCQKLLMEYNPTSPFVCRANNVAQRVKQMRGFVDNYKGMCYHDDYVCTLYNRIVVSDPRQPESAVKHYMYRPPDDNYNAVVIDFATFRDIKDCATFVRTNYDQRIQHVLFVRHNKVKLYAVVDFISKIFNVPVV